MFFLLLNHWRKTNARVSPITFYLSTFCPNFFKKNSLNFFHHHACNKLVILFVLISVGKALVREPEIRIPTNGVMDALGIVYP